ncbi:flagellar biosynthetic protein FliO [Sediminibacillus halophilus]|uniref:Flagellar protein FliO/FliZ n=1 Tax=Sediminibacillus halophilus TaxID=482461 RepID=A0A1G9MHQ8_9BACI|nr:flagellar biosynthetic protein FliO [Sediminibacillus halophilus]SDL73800.1 flagellar protein FliO/FliZ [Sediminibacillus halophilus]
MLKKFSVLAFILLSLWFVPATFQAAPSVKDCVGAQSDECKSDTGTTNEDDSESDGKQDNQIEPADKSSSGLFFYFIRLLLALGLVLALIYFLLKFLNRKNKMYQKVRALENIGGIALGPQKSLQIVRIGGKLFVVGVGDNVEMLSEITDEATKEELMKSDGEGSDLNPVTFLTSVMGKGKNTADTTGEEKQQHFSALFQSELDKLKQGRKRLIERRQNKDEDSNE